MESFEVNHNEESDLPIRVSTDFDGQIRLTVHDREQTVLVMQKSELKEIFEKVFEEE